MLHCCFSISRWSKFFLFISHWLYCLTHFDFGSDFDFQTENELWVTNENELWVNARSVRKSTLIRQKNHFDTRVDFFTGELKWVKEYYIWYEAQPEPNWTKTKWNDQHSESTWNILSDAAFTEKKCIVPCCLHLQWKVNVKTFRNISLWNHIALLYIAILSLFRSRSCKLRLHSWRWDWCCASICFSSAFKTFCNLSSENDCLHQRDGCSWILGLYHCSRFSALAYQSIVRCANIIHFTRQLAILLLNSLTVTINFRNILIGAGWIMLITIYIILSFFCFFCWIVNCLFCTTRHHKYHSTSHCVQKSVNFIDAIRTDSEWRRQQQKPLGAWISCTKWIV